MVYIRWITWETYTGFNRKNYISKFKCCVIARLGLNKIGDIYNLLLHKIDIDFRKWYGVEGEADSYLWASVEPFGLQISGKLKENDWIQWERIKEA